jgi:hypothetical protein
VHTRINGIRFENIRVTSPLILHRSLLGSDYDGAVADFRFVNVRIGGTVVTEQNHDRFFEIDRDRVKGVIFLEK